MLCRGLDEGNDEELIRCARVQTTSGDNNQSQPLYLLGGKGAFLVPPLFSRLQVLTPVARLSALDEGARGRHARGRSGRHRSLYEGRPHHFPSRV